MNKVFSKLAIILLIIVIVCISILVIYTNIVFPRKYKDIVEQACSLYNTDPNLIYAVIKQESKFNPDALSKSGAKGLMQIMKTTADDMARNVNIIDINNYDIYEPYTNIFLGTKYISYLINHFDGNYYLAIVAYNAGMGKVEGWLDKPYIEYSDFSSVYNCIQYNETKTYLQNVMNYYNTYTKLYT